MVTLQRMFLQVWKAASQSSIRVKQTIWINSLVIARQNVPITFIDSETTPS